MIKPKAYNKKAIEKINEEITIIGYSPLIFMGLTFFVLFILIINLAFFSIGTLLILIISLPTIIFYTNKNRQQKKQHKLEYIQDISIKNNLKKYSDKDGILNLIDKQENE